MRKIRFIHTGDLHLKDHKDIVFATFVDLIGQAKKLEVDFLLIAGDLFEDLTVSTTLIERTIKLFEYLKPIKVFISPGNHDPLKSNSPYLNQTFSDNVFIFKDSFSFIEFAKTRIYGRGFSNHFQETSLLETKDLDKEYINILLMHGEIGSSSLYNPISLDLLKQETYDYVALGHVHTYIKTDYYVYPGIPQGRGFDERGDGGYVYVEIDKGIKKTEYRKISKKAYIVREILAKDHWASNEIIKALREACTEKENSYRLIIKGNMTDLYDLSLIESILREEYSYLEIVDKRKEKVDLEALKKEISLKGIFVRKMAERLDLDPENEILQEALSLGLKAFEEDIDF